MERGSHSEKSKQNPIKLSERSHIWAVRSVIMKSHCRTKLLDRYRVTTKLGAGAFAVVYKATDLNSHREVALKVGKLNCVTVHEVNVMESLQGCVGFPLIYEARTIKGLRYIAMQLLGHSAIESFRAAKKHFSMTTIVDIITQGLERLKAMHEIGYIHRDIKPQHLIYEQGSQLIYLTDFGLSNSPSYSSDLLGDGKSQKIVGNARFSGINAHVTPYHTKADDLESMIYVALYFIKGTLPWDFLFDKDGDQWLNIRDVKQAYIESGCHDTLPVFHQVLSYLRSLRHNAKPDYDFVSSKIKEFENVFKSVQSITFNVQSLLLPKKVKEKNIKVRSHNCKSTRGHARKPHHSPCVSKISNSDNEPSFVELLSHGCDSITKHTNSITRIIGAPKMSSSLRQKVVELKELDRSKVF